MIFMVIHREKFQEICDICGVKIYISIPEVREFNMETFFVEIIDGLLADRQPIVLNKRT